MIEISRIDIYHFSAPIKEPIVTSFGAITARNNVLLRVESQGQRTRVSARRWKSAQIGLDTLRALQAAREADDVAAARVIGLGGMSDAALTFARDKGIEVWQALEIARAVKGLKLPPR